MKKKLLVLLLMVVPMFTFAQEKGLDQKIDAAFKPVSDFFSNLIFFTIPIAGIDVPFVLLLLVGSALFFTIYFKFPNIFHFKTAINVVRGKYDELDQHEAGDPALAIGGDIKGTIKDESTEGEVTHFQALATAVSGTVGNGNIAGVALAIALGGPGATF
ncbi:MAG: alanine:cation symporter family protein, partial [Flavobacteriaceae bacterium]|nr:alanine:cation symporter family protein [Flavobacteriaceae bacterium]